MAIEAESAASRVIMVGQVAFPTARPVGTTRSGRGLSDALHQFAVGELLLAPRGLAQRGGGEAVDLARDNGLALHVLDDTAPITPPPPSVTDAIERILAEADRPSSLRAIRAKARLRAARVSDALTALVTDGRVCKTESGYAPSDLAAPPP